MPKEPVFRTQEEIEELKEQQWRMANRLSLARNRADIAKKRRNKRAELSEYVTKVCAYGESLSPADVRGLVTLIDDLSESIQAALAPELLALLSLHPTTEMLMRLVRKLALMEQRAKAGALMAMVQKEQQSAPRYNKALWNPYRQE